MAEIQNGFSDVRKIKKYFILVENPWHIENNDMILFSQIGFPKTQLMNEFIELQFDAQLKTQLIEHREKQEYIVF